MASTRPLLMLCAATVATLAACCPDNGDPPLPESRAVVLRHENPETLRLIESCYGEDADACYTLCERVNDQLDVRRPEEYEDGYGIYCEVDQRDGEWVLDISYWPNVLC